MNIGDVLTTLINYGIALGVLAFLVMAVPRVWAKFRAASDDRDDEDDAAATPPKCPACGYDLRATPRQCPECGVILADRRRYLRSLGRDWPANAIEPLPTPGGVKDVMVVLIRTDNPTEADLLGQQLTARGVRCAIRRHRSTSRGVYDLERAEHFEVAVPAADERLSREYLCRAQGIPPELLEVALSGQRKVVVV